MKIIIGVGTVGFDAVRYFESNFSKIPRVTLLLCDKKFGEQPKILKSSSKIIKQDNVFRVERSNAQLSEQFSN